MDDSTLRDQVRDRYGAAATAVTIGNRASCCDDSCGESCAPAGGRYELSEREALPADALAASLGCGNPLAVADLREGETVVLDLGSGGGIDVLLSARHVGPTGTVYGLDMTDEMLALAQANARAAGTTNVEFLKGTIEAIPLPANTIDVIISNCVINLSVNKPAVFAEAYRVLRWAHRRRLHRHRDHPHPPGSGRDALRDRPRPQAPIKQVDVYQLAQCILGQ